MTHEINIKRLDIATKIMASFISRSNEILGKVIDNDKLTDKIDYYSKLSYKIADSLIKTYNENDNE